VDGLGVAGRREMWAGSDGLPLLHGCGKAGAASGRSGRRLARGVRVGAPVATRAGRVLGGAGGVAGSAGVEGRSRPSSYLRPLRASAADEK